MHSQAVDSSHWKCQNDGIEVNLLQGPQTETRCLYSSHNTVSFSVRKRENPSAYRYITTVAPMTMRNLLSEE